MRKIIKTKVLISVLFIALLCISIVMPTSAKEPALTESGNCGDNARWEYYASTGELKITGSGEMDYYDSVSAQPWDYYRSVIKSVFISAGITHISEYAFDDCVTLTDVIFEEGSQLKSIAHSAFVGCKSLECIEIPSSVMFIAMSAFDSCVSLQKVTFGVNSQLKGIGDAAFHNCDAMTSIEIPSNVESLGYMAFAKCDSMTSITLLSNEVVTIDRTTFSFTDLESIYVSPTAIEEYKEDEEWEYYEDIIFSFGKIIFSNCRTQVGKTISVDISIETNPGIAIAIITLDYDETALTLKEVKNGEIFGSMDTGLNLLWSSDKNCVGDGVLATLTFEVNDNAEAKDYTITATVNEVLNGDFEEVTLTVNDGTITVYDFIYGDADGNGSVGAADVLLLRKYMANYNYTTQTSTVEVQDGADTNGDGTVNAADVLLMRKYMANYNYQTGTSTIILGPKQ